MLAPRSMPLVRLLGVALCWATFMPGVVLADTAPGFISTEAGLCPEIAPRPARATPVVPTPKLEPTHIRAQQVRGLAGDISEFLGDVELTRTSQQLSADFLRYDKKIDQADASGDVQFTTDMGDRIETPELHLQLENRIGFSGPSLFQIGGTLGRGDAERIEFQGPDHTRLKRVRYTTCAIGQDDWFLRVRDLRLDTAEGVGTARNAKLEFMDVPLFYLPYLTFPISDKRKSGFLVPQVGYGSELGTLVAAPYYWNVAPNYDATLTPRILSKRGLQLQNQFRYLGASQQGQLEVELLPSDDITGENRAAGSYWHRQVFNPLWSGSVNLHGISDKNYLSDFGDHLGVTSQTHLPQNAEVNYQGALWTFTARASDYQTVDRTIGPFDRPYARLPQLLLATRPLAPSNELQYRFESELVNFDRAGRVAGQRVNANPSLSYPLVRSYGFFTPELSFRHIGYQLDGTSDEAPSVTRGLLGVDSGLIFERDTQIGARAFTQTLEPRLYYLYVPYKDQDTLPNFDTTIPDFSFSNLFRNNRFIGGDRIGDANQLTLAVTTRFLDEADGAERLRASLGQIRYFTDRRVNIPAGVTATNGSDFVAEAVAWLIGNWHVRGAVQWNPYTDETQRSNGYLQYQPAPNRIVNIGHRTIRNEIEQWDISAEWPVAARWTARARSLYSTRDRQNVESYAGFEYNACCWALRLHAARRLAQTSSTTSIAEQTNAIMLELELTGLSKLGSAPESPLRQGLHSFPTAPSRTQVH